MGQRHLDMTNGPFYTRRFSLFFRGLRRDRRGSGGPPPGVSPVRALFAAGALAMAACSPAIAAESTFEAPAAQRTAKEGRGLKTAIFAGGCFWGVEAVFSHTKGVTSAVSGYHGGTAATAHYDMVSAGGTDHAEAVRVTYDPAVVRYDQLLRVLFSVVADPTLKNRQGPDSGTQYRAAIFPLNAEQRQVAAAYLGQMRSSGVWDRPIVVEVETASRFYVAEEYHQDYYANNPNAGYCQIVINPKIENLRSKFSNKLKD